MCDFLISQMASYIKLFIIVFLIFNFLKFIIVLMFLFFPRKHNLNLCNKSTLYDFYTLSNDILDEYTLFEWICTMTKSPVSCKNWEILQAWVKTRNRVLNLKCFIIDYFIFKKINIKMYTWSSSVKNRTLPIFLQFFK